MAKPSYDDLSVFLAVDREGNFTRAAAKLGVSPSAVSQTIRGLEEQLGVRLLTRSTRSVTRTEAGDKLLARLAPMYDEMDMLLAEVSSLREKPAGTVRITADEIAIEQVLWPKLKKVLDDYPEITVELMTDYGLTDIVAERFDAGVRLGELIASDMIAVPIAPEMRMTVVAAPRYLDTHQKPTHPHDLTRHICINLRLPTHGGLFAWEFSEKWSGISHSCGGGNWSSTAWGRFCKPPLMATDWHKCHFARLSPTCRTAPLVEVLQDWSEPFAGYHLYYPSRRQQTAAFRVVVEALRHHS